MGNREFGNINIIYHYGIPNSGVGEFEFCLVESGTNNPVTVTNFSFTVWDLDNRGNDRGNNGIGLKEKLAFDTSQTYNYSVFPSFEDSWVSPICEDGSTVNCTDPECTGVHPGHISCDPGVQTVFRGTKSGGLGDNPVTVNSLTDDQRKRAVFFLFENTSCFQFTYSLYCPLEPPHDVPGLAGISDIAPDPDITSCRATNAHPYGGANFLFAGTSEALFTEAGCPTEAPSRYPTRAPTVSPTPEPTPFPTASSGDCPIETDPATNAARYGEMKFCVRSSLGYSYGAANTFQEVNFIESLVKIRYNLESGFCVADFNVEPKERIETTQEEAYALQAWLCDTSSMTNHFNPVRQLPTRVTNYDTVGGTDYYNQGALITVCVSPDDEAYAEGIRMSSLTDFTWKRDSFSGLPSLAVEQTAIENSSPAGNYLTYYDSTACSGAEWCTFSSILFADFYINTGSVTGSGTAQLEFARRRLKEDRRMLQGEDSSSVFDLKLGVIGMDDGPAALKRAGAMSLRFSALYCVQVFFAGLALLA